MGKKRHTVERISLPILLSASLLVLAGFMPIRLGALEGVVADALRCAGADSVTVGEVTVTPWRGVRVKNVRTHKHISAREEYYADIAGVDIDCSLIGAALLAVTDPSVLKPNRDLFREVYESPLKFAGDASALAVSIGPLKKVTLRGAGLRFVKTEEKKDRKGKTETRHTDGVSISGVSADIAVRGGRQKTLSGGVSVKEATVPSLAVIEDFGIKLTAGGGRLALTNGNGKIFGGTITADIELGTDTSRILSGRLSLKGMDLEQFRDGTKFSPGRLAGIVNLDAEAEPGTPAKPDSIRASGSASVTRLSVSDLALQRTPAVNQVSKDLRQLQFMEVKSGFRLSEAKVRFDEITGKGEVMNFRSAGWIDFDGKLHQDFEGEFAPQFVNALPKLVRNSLEKTEDGGGKFKCRITGTFHRPRVDVDKSVYNRALRNLFK